MTSSRRRASGRDLFSAARDRLIRRTEQNWELTKGIKVSRKEIKFNSTRNRRVEFKAKYSRAVRKD